MTIFAKIVAVRLSPHHEEILLPFSQELHSLRLHGLDIIFQKFQESDGRESLPEFVGLHQRLQLCLEEVQRVLVLFGGVLELHELRDSVIDGALLIPPLLAVTDRMLGH